MSASEPLVVDQSGPAIRIRGADRVRFLNGMCMGNVATLAPGSALRTAMLNAKGRVVSLFEVVAGVDELILLLEPALVGPTAAALERHAIADDVAFEVVELAVHRRWGEPAQVWDAPPVFGSPPGPVAAAAAVEIRRVEAGLPRFGVDLTDDNFPFETPLDRLIDYKKGCYVGQEPVARVAARGSPSKLLRGLVLEGTGPVPAGSPVEVAGRADAGVVTSSVVSPRFGPIALAYLGRGAWDVGGAAVVAGRAAVVSGLPFDGPG